MQRDRNIVVLAAIVAISILLGVFSLALAQNAPLPLISALLALAGVLIAQVVNTHIARSSQTNQQELEDRRARAASLQSYLEQTAKLLTDHNLRDFRQGGRTDDLREIAKAGDTRKIAQAQTLSVLEGLGSDPTRKRILMQFLFNTEMIKKNNPIVRLQGADFNGADLSNVRLNGSDSRAPPDSNR